MDDVVQWGPMSDVYGAVEAGGTKFVCAVGTAPDDIREERRFPTAEPVETLAETYPDVVALLRGRMEAWLEQRGRETGLPNPIHHQGDWHGPEGVGAFKTSQQAYDPLHIGDVSAAQRLQATSREAK